MNKLGIGRRDKVQQFMTITGASEKVALQALKVSDWNLEGAFDVFYSQSQVKSSADTRRLEELYNRYKDPYADMILADGISLLCNDMQVDPQDIVMGHICSGLNKGTSQILPIKNGTSQILPIKNGTSQILYMGGDGTKKLDFYSKSRCSKVGSTYIEVPAY